MTDEIPDDGGQDEDELRQAAAAALGEESGEEGFLCPHCGTHLATQRGLTRHIREMHGEGKERKASGREKVQAGIVLPSEEILQATENKLAENVAMVGIGFAVIGVTYTGLTIESRAPMTAHLVMGYARRDPRILRAVQRFNALFEGSAVVELAAMHVTAAAVDARVLDPHGGFVAFGRELRPAEMLIGDVVQHVDDERAKQEAQAAEPTPPRARRRREPPAESNGVSETGAEVIPGPVTAT